MLVTCRPLTLYYIGSLRLIPALVSSTVAFWLFIKKSTVPYSDSSVRVFVDLGEHLFPLILSFRKITDFVVHVSYRRITLF